MIGFTISASSNVSIGGVPMPSFLSMAMGRAFRVLFKGLGKGIQRLRYLLKRRTFSRVVAQKSSEEVTRVMYRPTKDNIDYPAQFGRAHQLIQELEHLQAIRIKDPHAMPGFANAVRTDLRRIACSKTGQKLLNEIKANKLNHGTHVEIDPMRSSDYLQAGGPGPHCDVPTKARLNPDDLSRGTPSNTTVRYMPGEQVLPGGQHNPSDATLTHELGHAKNGGEGNSMSGIKHANDADARRWTNLEEEQVINNYDNPYREERGLPQRFGHGDLPE
jgi:hypothetical protein